jgi:uncharacterized membrane protein (DUF485 family)
MKLTEITENAIATGYSEYVGGSAVLPAAVSEIEKGRRSIVRPLLVFSMAFYGLGLVALAYFPGMAGLKVSGSINVAYVLALSQFVMTFAVAYVYARRANNVIDPLVTQTFAAMSRARAPGAAS